MELTKTELLSIIKDYPDDSVFALISEPKYLLPKTDCIAFNYNYLIYTYTDVLPTPLKQ
jgi:hypothetical protein